jgi:hypothetical protein
MCILCQQAFLGAAPPAALLEATEAPAAISPQAQALLASSDPGWNKAAFGVGRGGVVGFSFAETPETGSSTTAATFAPFSEAQRASARAALDTWAAICGLVFVEVPDRPGGQGIDIRFQLGTVPAGAAATGGYPTDGTITVARDSYRDDPMSPGSRSFALLLHEIGHTLGLKHPFEASSANPVTLSPAEDNGSNTVMSYNRPDPVSSPRPFDVEAVQYIYGTQAQEPAWARTARYDPAVGGVRITGTSAAEEIWTPGRFGGVDGGGGDDRIIVGSGSGTMLVWGGDGNDVVTVGFRTGVTRVWGGNGKDIITLGQNFSNETGGFAWGEGGNDELIGSGGNDWLSGGPGINIVNGKYGVDTLAFEGGRRSITLDRSIEFFITINGDRVNSFRGTGTGPGETTTFNEIENFAFLDGRLVFHVGDPIMQAYRLYQAVLGRAPDPVGLNGWGDAIAKGMTVAQAAAGFIGSPEFAARFGNPDNPGFVTVTYQNVLGRAPDATGYNNWLGALNGGMSRAEMIAGFSESAELKNRLAPQLTNGLWDQDEGASAVARLYQATLGRRPEEAGLRNWKGALEGGMDLKTMAAGFMGAPEFAARFGNPDNGQFVNLLYANVLGRAPEPAGFANWKGALDAGQIDRPSAVTGFSESLEFRLNTQSWVEGGILFA